MKNVRKLLSVLLALVLCAGLVTPAFAVTYDISKGDVTVNADGSSTGVKEGDETASTNAKDDEGVIVTGTTTEHNITVSSGAADADITLKDANIDVSGTTGRNAKAALSIGTGSDVTVNLEGKSTLKSGSGKAGLSVNDGAAVTIDGTGNLTATGKANFSNGSAGIGGDAGKDAGTITIKGGNITANGSSTGGTSSGAGIGGGGSGSATRIEITGGTVKAKAGQEGTNYNGGAGIGGGACAVDGTHGTGGTIHIGGTADVTAEGAVGGAGIGSGYQCNPTTAGENKSEITIDDSAKVTATGHGGGAGIGGGQGSDKVNIEISGSASVNATGDATFSTAGAGIGSGNNYSNEPSDSAAQITIKDNATVTATGNQTSAGIGGGQGYDGGTINISTTGKVTATGGSTPGPYQVDSGGAGIGGGADGGAGRITIDGAKDVTAVGGGGASGIGGGAFGNGGSVTIQNGAAVNAQGGNKAAGIGGGYNGQNTTVSISSSDVTAVGGDFGAGIGGGCYGMVEAISISGGDIVAISGKNASGIGNGDGGYGGTIAINGTNSLLVLGDSYFAIDTERAGYTGDQSILNGKFKEEPDSNGLTLLQDTEFVVVDAQGNEVKRFTLTAGADGSYLHESFATLLPEGTYYVFDDSQTYGGSIAGYNADNAGGSGYNGEKVAYVIEESQLLTADLMQFPSYSVSYQFVSGTEGQTLPEAITSLLPEGGTGKAMTLAAFNHMLGGGTLDDVAVEGGTWTFGGWSQSGAINENGMLSDVALEGTWTFAPASVDPGPGPVDPQPPYIPPYVPPTPDDDIDIADEDVPLAGAIGLNLEDHFAYVAGYPDGTVHPTGNITRAEVATIFFRLLTEETRAIYWSQVNDYSDVAPENWYNNAVSTLSSMGIVSGYPDGTFRPDAPITRAEFAKIAVGFFAYQDVVYTGIFSDVADGQWWTEYIAAAVELGLVAGYPDGTFRPQANISRAESCAIVNRVLERKPHEAHLLPEEQMNLWPDNADKAAWYYADIQEATNSHDYDFIGADDLHDHEDAEQWTEKLPERDWAALEQEWSTANAAPGSEVMG